MKLFIVLALSLLAASAHPIWREAQLTELDTCDDYQESVSSESFTGIPNIIEVDADFLASLGLIVSTLGIEGNDESVVANDVDGSS
ncbi:hypothetical protein IWW39_002100 [Coemansia spiralis]|uniref:Uncharacterized protein n=1 Tax=Coemansia spiralis TaxID=417178 RepID=A0A9W8L3X7_9FUNG|nr:hypothetical protein IWW39_002100 [Coemansia spiralis]